MKKRKPVFNHYKAVRMLIIIVFQFSKDYPFKQNDTNLFTKIESIRTSLNCQELLINDVVFSKAFQEFSVIMLVDFFPD